MLHTRQVFAKLKGFEKVSTEIDPLLPQRLI